MNKEDVNDNKFYYLKVLPHPNKDGVKGTKEKAVEMQKALQNFGISVFISYEYR